MRPFLKTISFFLSAGIFLTAPFTETSVFAAKKETRWIPFGSPHDSAESRIAEEGELQPFPGLFSITPLLESKGQWLTQKDADIHLSFQEGALPIPNVVWNFDTLRLEIKAFAWGPPEKSLVYVRYRLKNKAAGPVRGKLYFMLTPASEKKIQSLDFSEEAQTLKVNGAQTLLFPVPPSEAGFFKHSGGKVLEKIKARELSQIHSVKDEQGRASGAWNYDFDIQEGKSLTVGLLVPLTPDADLETADFKKSLLDARAFWRKKISRIQFQIEDPKKMESVRAQASSLFVMRDNAGLYPEFNQRESLWTGKTLDVIQTYLQYGFFEEAREDLEMVSLRLNPLSEVQVRMKDIPEEGSLHAYQLQGKFISAVWNYYAYTRDKTWLASKSASVKSVLEYLKYLRKQRLRKWYALGPDQKRFYGILPPSMNPEQGDRKSQHRYADDLWALKAFKDGKKIAAVLELDSEWMTDEETALRRNLLESIEITASKDNVRFIPQAAENTDMAPSPGTLVIWPAEENTYFPSLRLNDHFGTIDAVFEKNLTTDTDKADVFSDFHVIQAFLRREEKARVRGMFQFQSKRLGFGNVSKTAGYLQTFRDFFVYESGEKLILGAGILPEWTAGEKGLSVSWPTPYGTIAYKMLPVKNGWKVLAEGDANPPEGFIFHSPSGKARQIFHRLPADFEIQEN